MYYVGVDIGGMSIKTGIVSLDGKILYTSTIKTENISPEKQIEKLGIAILDLLHKSNIDKSEVLGIGVGCPGAIISSKGVVRYSSNLKWIYFPLKEILEECTGIKVRVANDADSATIGEITFGVAKNYNNVIMLTIGTGIGGGIVINKKLYEGTNGVVAELGHITLKYNGLKCGCGRRGCFEKYASATALISQTKKAMMKNKNSLMWETVKGNIKNVDGKTAFISSKNGDETAIKVINQYIEYLSEGILNYCNVFRPDAIVLGGGISKEGSYLTEKIVNYLEKMHYGYINAPKCEVLTAKLGNDAGILGAASLIAEED